LKKRTTVRAILIDSMDRLFLAQHNERDPQDLGKWGTVGGGLDEEDKDFLSCLKREIREEFGENAVLRMNFGSYLGIHERKDRVDHFFVIETKDTTLSTSQPEEILDTRFFTLAEVDDLRSRNLLFFGIEADFFRMALKDR
jgi:8-oxo-dGTP pyrophosphatase MutT (NUDIX family)